MRIVTTIEPATEPVTLQEAKQHARVSIDVDDSLIETYIKSARRYAESYTHKSFITQTKEIYFNYHDFVPRNQFIRLPISPIQTISSFTTYDDQNVGTIVSTDDYYLGNGGLVLNSSYYWPSYNRYIDTYKVVATVGFGDAEDVPEDIKQAILMLVAHSYQNREALHDPVNSTPSNTMPFGVTSLLSTYKEYAV
jgi:uncharacterized phiE125 gp8 family phage protein